PSTRVPSRLSRPCTSACASASLLLPCRLRRDPHSFPTRRSSDLHEVPITLGRWVVEQVGLGDEVVDIPADLPEGDLEMARRIGRSEEHTSELQSRFDLVCRLLLEKKHEAITLRASPHATRTAYYR